MVKFLDIGVLSHEKMMEVANLPEEKRKQYLSENFYETDLTKITKESTRRVAPMTFFEEFICILIFAFGIPGSVFTFPILFIIIGLYLGCITKTVIIGCCILSPLAFKKIEFKLENLSSWAAFQIVRYFSYKTIAEVDLPDDKGAILVAPPHGVFPFGNITTIIAFPFFMGFPIVGVASSAAFVTPCFKQCMEFVGIRDASRKTCTELLENERIVGISTGGVAEVFETDSSSDGDGDECIVLQSRKGICKLAMRTGKNLVPCYLFGNSKSLSLFSGGPMHNTLKNWSRRIGFALILFWGRFGLAIPYREPIVGVLGKPIVVEKNENPTQEEIDDLHARLLERTLDVFNKYKGYYGWENKRLIIK